MKKFFPVLQYLNLPNLITTLGLIFGIAACFYLSEGSLKGILICLFFSSLMDLLDGFIAGKFNQQTGFGKYADTLVDFFICCIIPILTIYFFVGNSLLIISSLTFYCVCGLWRLAHFGVTTKKDNYFTGLPVPGAMLLVMITVWAVLHYGFPIWLCVVIFYLIALLMISSIKLLKYGFWQKALWVIWLGFLPVIILT